VSDKILIFGSTGQLGTDLVNIFQASGSFEVIPLTHEDADCRDADAVRRVVRHIVPLFVINCAAYVRVDDCEDHPLEAFEVNAIGALNIARASADVDARCVYISTDYVFDGEKKSPYQESDRPNPINVYGASKLAGEYCVRQSAPRWLIVRVSSLFGNSGARGKGGNFIETIIAKSKTGEPVRVIDDIRITPTYTKDAAMLMKAMLDKDMCGIVHSANRESCTWSEFAKSALSLCNISTEVIPVPSSAYQARARRPRCSALAPTIHLPQMPVWRDALMRYLVEKGHIGSLARA
jgi:dTDP-4-dehydrorhamnose reductase